MADRSAIALLLRRAGFGPTSSEVDAASAAGYGPTVAALLDFTGTDPADASPVPTFAPYQPRAARSLTLQQRQAINHERTIELRQTQLWWLSRMTSTSHPLREKLTWFWHTHFATSFDKVQRADLMYRQNQLFRAQGAGNFEVLTQAVAKDPAMMLWLDTATDKKAHPNENFARESMELFTLGIGNYTEADVRDAARAFTGWVISPLTESWALQARQHDDGIKTVLGQTGDWGGEDVVHILVNSPASHRWIVAGVWSHFAYPVATTDPVVNDLVPGYTADLDITNLVKATLLNPQITSSQARTGLIKQPVEWVVGALRALGLPTGEDRVVTALTALGQVPLRPPNVGGWPQNEYWLTTASSLARLQIAAVAVNLADLSPVTDVPAAQRVDATANLLSVDWSAPTAAALDKVADNPKELVALALVSPDYLLN